MNISEFEEFNLDLYDKKCVARIHCKKRKKERISFSADPWLISEFKETFDLDGDDWNDWFTQMAKKRVEDKGITPKVIEHMRIELEMKQQSLDQADKMLVSKGGAMVKAINKYFLGELDRIRRLDRNGIARDWRTTELEQIIRESRRKYKLELADVNKILRQLTEHYKDPEREKVEDAIYNMAEEIIDQKDGTGLSEHDRLVLEASNGGSK